MEELGRSSSTELHAGLKRLTFGVEIECITPLGNQTEDSLKQDVSGRLKEAGLGRVAEELGAADETQKDFLLRTGTVTDGSVVEPRDANLNTCWKVMDDSTIKTPDDGMRGVEIASPVFQFDLNSADKLVTICKELCKLGAATNDSTGLHVHIAQLPDFFSDEEILRVYKAYLKYEPVLNLLLPPSRVWGGCAYKFCKDNRKKVQECFKLDSDDDDASLFQCIDKCRDAVGLHENFCSDRYVKLNVKNIVGTRRTLEFRQFPGEAANPVTICNWARLLGCLVTCTRLATEILPLARDATLAMRTQDFIAHILDSVSQDEIGFKAWFLWRIHEMEELRQSSSRPQPSLAQMTHTEDEQSSQSQGTSRRQSESRKW